MIRPSSRNRTVFLIITMLVMINVGLLVYFFMQRGEADQGRRPRYLIVREWLSGKVGFDSSQMKQYHALRERNRTLMKTSGQRIMRSKDSLFRLVKDPSASPGAIDSAATRIGQYQKELDLQLFQHFSRIRGLCRPDQLRAFDEGVEEIVREVTGPSRRGPDRDKK